MISSTEVVNLIDKELLFESNTASKQTLQRLKTKIESMEEKALDQQYLEQLKDEEERKKEMFKKANAALEDAFKHA